MRFLNKAWLAAMVLGLCACGHRPPEPAAPRQAGFIELKDPAGHTWRAYAAGSPDAPAGVLVVHDYFGISDFTTSAVERLAGRGYRVLAIDLYHARSARSHDAAYALLLAFQAQDRALGDAALQAGLDALKRPGRRLATLGFSMGGIESLRAKLNDPGAVQATAIVYGSGFDQLTPDRLARLDSPLLSVTGALDPGSVQASVGFLATAGAGGKSFELYVFPGAGHAYAQPLFDGGKGYNAQATEATWRVTEDFLARHLGTPAAR